MKKIIIIILCFLPFLGNAQPLYMYSQFGLPEVFGRYTTEIVGIYQQRLYADKTPMFSSFSPSNIRQSERYMEEEEIPIRHKLDSLVPRSQYYTLICPVYRICNKVLIGVFPGGTECIWQQPQGSLFYMITQGPTTLALMYDKATGVVRKATDDEKLAFFSQTTPNLYGYAGK